MIKGILLGISLAGFITSFIFLITSSLNILKENIITGAVVGTQQVVSYSIVGLVVSAVVGIIVISKLR